MSKIFKYIKKIKIMCLCENMYVPKSPSPTDDLTLSPCTYLKLMSNEDDKKYINKKERERHLPGYCQ